MKSLESTNEWRREPRAHGLGEPLAWGIPATGLRSSGYINDQSDSGIAFMAPRNQLPEVGQIIIADLRNSSAEYEVVRVEELEGALALVGCLARPAMTSVVEPMGRERRRSDRRETYAPIHWRPERGRRDHRGFVTEHSQHGMVIEAPLHAAAAVGTTIFPADNRIGRRHGFEAAVVRRTAQPDAGHVTLFCEFS